MKYFHYIVTEDEVKAMDGEVDFVPDDFIEYKSTFIGRARIHYRLKNGKLTELISEGFHEDTARRRVDEFLAGFNVSLV